MSGKGTWDRDCDGGGAWPRLGDRLWRLVWRIREWIARRTGPRR
jgi:hypothetical protein